MTPNEALKIRKNPHFEDVDNEELSGALMKHLKSRYLKSLLNLIDKKLDTH